MDYDIGMGIATFKILLLLHVVIQTLIYYILTEIIDTILHGCETGCNYARFAGCDES